MIQEIGTDVAARNYSTGVLQQVPGAYSASSPGDPNQCVDYVTFTNIGDNTIVVKGAVITNVVSSKSNSFHYNLFACAPYPSLGDCPPAYGTYAGCNLVFALVPGTPRSSLEQDCSQATVQIVPPQQSGALVLILSSTYLSQLYKVNISLVLGDGSKVILPAHFDDVLVFASPRQFSCYAAVNGKLAQVSAQTSHCF
jgi:hypothetical protein